MSDFSPEFEGFEKLARWNREVFVTEKIDGTNAQVVVSDDGLSLIAGSRTRWITPSDDNFGFARWVEENKTDLLNLGPGRHFGEWFGKGIQRNYGLADKRFSLFNVSRWDTAARPACCSVVPTLWRGNMEDLDVTAIMNGLRDGGSVAAPGWSKPEGIVIYHVASGQSFKKTFDKDDAPKNKPRDKDGNVL